LAKKEKELTAENKKKTRKSCYRRETARCRALLRVIKQVWLWSHQYCYQIKPMCNFI